MRLSLRGVGKGFLSGILESVRNSERKAGGRCTREERAGWGGEEKEEKEGCSHFREGVPSFTPGRMVENQQFGASVVDPR